MECIQLSLFGKTFPEHFQVTRERTSALCWKSLPAWNNQTLPFLDLRIGGGRWSKAGAIVGDGWSLAWRQLDAQYWGVPQRRKRIALVADFRGQRAGEILFERTSLQGDLEPSKTKGKGSAAGVEAGADGASYAVRIRGGCDGGGKGALIQAEKSGTLGCNNDQTIFCLQGNGIDRADTAGCNGKGWKENISYTLNTIDRHAVCAGSSVLRAQEHGHQPCVLDITHACDVVREYEGIVPSLQERMGTGGNQVPLIFRQRAFGDYTLDEISSTCKMRDCKDATDLIIAAVDCRNGAENPYINGTLQAKSNGGISLNLQNTVRINKRVRRLTPLECERLQGYPDGYRCVDRHKGKTTQTG